MASDHHPTRTSRKALFEEFYRALVRLRRGVHTDKLAELLLTRDRPRQSSRSSTAEERAVVFEGRERRVVAEWFDTHGFGESTVLWEHTNNPAAWIDARQDELDWVRSEYRWVLAMDNEQSAWGYWNRKDGPGKGIR